MNTPNYQSTTGVSISDARLQELTRATPALLGLNRAQKATRGVLLLGFLALILLALWRIDATPARIADGFSRLGFLLKFMWPPTSGGNGSTLAWAMLETLSIALIGTLLGAVFSVPLGFLGARNIVSSRWIRLPLRRLFDLIRGVDLLIFAMIFISVIGLGPFAGILAIAVNDVGNFSKLYAEAIENVDNKPVAGTVASGCNRLESIRFGILPQVLPVMLSHTLYFFESNVRAAAIIGIVGAGGIGFQLSERMRGNYWDQAAFIILVLFVTVAIIDRLSYYIRSKVIGR